MWSNNTNYRILSPPKGNHHDTSYPPSSIPLRDRNNSSPNPRFASTPPHLDPNSSPRAALLNPTMKFNHHDNEGIEVVQSQPGLELSPQGALPAGAFRDRHAPNHSDNSVTSYFNYDPNKSTSYLGQASQGPLAVGREQRIAGLRPRSFWAVITLLVLILAAGIGAGVGVGLSNRNDDDDSSASESTSSTGGTQFRAGDNGEGMTSSPLTPTSYCPKANGTILFPHDNKTGQNITDHGGTPLAFQILCMTSYPVVSNQFTVTDLVHVYEPSLYDCIQACALYNNVQNETRCAGVGLERFKGGYCYLKNTTYPDLRAAMNYTDSNIIDSGVLIPLDEV